MLLALTLSPTSKWEADLGRTLDQPAWSELCLSLVQVIPEHICPRGCLQAALLVQFDSSVGGHIFSLHTPHISGDAGSRIPCSTSDGSVQKPCVSEPKSTPWSDQFWTFSFHVFPGKTCHTSRSCPWLKPRGGLWDLCFWLLNRHWPQLGANHASILTKLRWSLWNHGPWKTHLYLYGHTPNSWRLGTHG